MCIRDSRCTAEGLPVADGIIIGIAVGNNADTLLQLHQNTQCIGKMCIRDRGEDARLGAAAQPHHAAGGAALAVQHLHQGGFACAVGAGNDEPLAAADGIGEGLQQGAVADLNGQVLEQHQLIPRLHVVFEAELELVGLVLRGLGDLQLFQLPAAALGHLGGGGADEVAVDVVL